MADSLAGVALGAGAGRRLRPLTLERPKVLCPVAGVSLIDHALTRLRAVTESFAVNAHVSQTQLIDHVHALGAHLSPESPNALGTGGALGALRDWIDGRPTIVVNGDTWCPGGLDRLVDGWDGTSIRILIGGREPLGPRARIAGAAMPWADVARLEAVPSGLWEVSWRRALSEGRVESVAHDGPFVDCADPADYLRANLLAAGGSSIASDAVVDGQVVDSVVWPGARVRSNERLWRAIRTPHRTVLVRSQIDDG